MSIFAALGDDDHTAADGPYARLMKVRKWLFIVGTAAVILTSGLYKPTALTELLKFLELPVWLVGQSIAAGLLYLILQYAALSFQLNRTYDIVLEERLIYRRADEVSKSSTAVDVARSALQQHRNKMIEAARTHLNGAEALLEATRAQSEKFLTSRQHALFSLHEKESKKSKESVDASEVWKSLSDLSASSLRVSAENALKDQKVAEYDARVARQHFDDLTRKTWIPNDPQSEALYAAVERAQRELEGVQRMNPADRKGYRDAEKGLDWLRLLPPPVFAIIALIKLTLFAL